MDCLRGLVGLYHPIEERGLRGCFHELRGLDLGAIAAAVEKAIPNIDWGSSRNEEDPDDDEIMYEALKVIYRKGAK